MHQLTFHDPSGPLHSKSAVMELIRGWMDSEWRSAIDFQEMLKDRGVYASDSSITARIRDLRKPKYGGMKIDCKCERKGRYVYRAG
jgi:hypothetical protein